jgi:diguanylate cyclase (GGDEF)-like protein
MDASPMREGLLITVVDITDLKRAFLEIEHQRKMLVDEMEQRRGLEQELWALAHLDPLTTLPNRRAFRDAAMLKLAESLTAHRPCAMITLDIDHFKRVNDAYGHGAGDTVLRRVADSIKAPLRPNTDIAARMGGEEFSVLLPDTDSEAAMAFETSRALRRRVARRIITGATSIAFFIGAAPLPHDLVVLTPLQGVMVMGVSFLSERASRARMVAEWTAGMGLNVGAGVAPDGHLGA